MAKSRQSVSKEQIISKVKFYISDIKSMVGLAITLYALYSGFTTIPEKFNKYTAAVEQNKQLTEKRDSVSLEEAKLKAISKELDKLTTGIVEVEVGKSPELALIDVAQKVIDLSESANNRYVSLKPGTPGVVNFDSSVTLPLNLPDGVGGGGSGGSSESTAPAPAAATGGTSTGAAVDPKTSLAAFQYSLEIRGSYATLVTFINNLAKYSNLVIVTKIDLKSQSGGSDNSKEGEADSGNIAMSIDFTIPWMPGAASAVK